MMTPEHLGPYSAAEMKKIIRALEAVGYVPKDIDETTRNLEPPLEGHSGHIIVALEQTRPKKYRLHFSNPFTSGDLRRVLPGIGLDWRES